MDEQQQQLEAALRLWMAHVREHDDNFNPGGMNVVFGLLNPALHLASPASSGGDASPLEVAQALCASSLTQSELWCLFKDNGGDIYEWNCTQEGDQHDTLRATWTAIVARLADGAEHSKGAAKPPHRAELHADVDDEDPVGDGQLGGVCQPVEVDAARRRQIAGLELRRRVGGAVAVAAVVAAAAIVIATRPFTRTR